MDTATERQVSDQLVIYTEYGSIILQCVCLENVERWSVVDKEDSVSTQVVDGRFPRNSRGCNNFQDILKLLQVEVENETLKSTQVLYILK